MQFRSRMRYAAVAGLAATALVAAPAAAGPDDPVRAVPMQGYVWASLPKSAGYTANSGYEYNSAGGPVEIIRTAVGRYQVRFVDMGAIGGVAHVNAYGSGNNGLCTLADWGPSGADELLDVRCFTAAGKPRDSRFVANVTGRKPAAGSLSYLWAHDPVPASGSYQPSPKYTFDSSGSPAEVHRTGVGRYLVYSQAVDATWPDTDDGIFQVTATGTDPVHCQAHGVQDEMPIPLPVMCRDPKGTLVDARFTFTYARGVDLLGGTALRGNARVRPDNQTWLPYLEGWWNPGGQPIVTLVSTGVYLVRFPGLAAPHGHAIAAASGSGALHYCTVGWWAPAGADELVLVSCYRTADHSPVTEIVTVSFTSLP